MVQNYHIVRTTLLFMSTSYHKIRIMGESCSPFSPSAATYQVSKSWSPSTTASAWTGVLFRMRAALPLIRSKLSLWKRCLVCSSASDPKLCVSTLFTIFVRLFIFGCFRFFLLCYFLFVCVVGWLLVHLRFTREFTKRESRLFYK